MKRIVNICLTKLIYLISIQVLYMLPFPTSSPAARVSELDVRNAVETWVRHVTADARPDAVIERMEPYIVEGETVAYITHLSGRGYCLCGADDVVLPVYFYSPNGRYDEDNSGNQAILWEIETRTKFIEQCLSEDDPVIIPYRSILAGRSIYWQQLASGTIPPQEGDKDDRQGPEKMELPLTCRWGQGSLPGAAAPTYPYNDFCPVLTPGSDEHAKAGCVAVAMAQIMYYWRWPSIGQGRGDVDYNFRSVAGWIWEPLPKAWGAGWIWRIDGRDRLQWIANDLGMTGYWDNSVLNRAQGFYPDPADADYRAAVNTLYGRLIAGSTNYAVNFGAANYQWHIMPDSCRDPADAGDRAVATLIYHAGVATDANYGLYNTGVTPQVIDDAFEDHFRYDTDVRFDRPINTDTMIEEIQWLRTLALGGLVQPPARGGHCWVVYGYNKRGPLPDQFKMNMGWNGQSNGWYTCDTVPQGYTHNQAHITMIAPRNVVRFVGDTNPGDGSPDDPHQNIEEAIPLAPVNATLIFKAGSNNTFAGPSLTIRKPLTLKGWDATLRKR
jgi:hypothetical protein